MNGKEWTRSEVKLLEYCYADSDSTELAELMGRRVSTILAKANALGLKKDRKFIAAQAAKQMSNPSHAARKHQFKPGRVPQNKGVKRPGFAAGRMAETQFKRGNRPHTWKPVGSTRINADGYLDLKISDTGYAPRDWVGAHILLWEDAHGAVPSGHAVVFRDGDKLNLTLENLEMVSRAELMRRNTVHNLPKELVQVIQLNGALKRKIRRLTREEQDGGSTQSPV